MRISIGGGIFALHLAEVFKVLSKAVLYIE